MLETRNRHRKIHLDFHNSPLIPTIGDAFDADAFASTLADAQVNYVVCFAKCHHGMCYYNAGAGTRHPGLSFDLLAAQIESCHRHDIAVSAYLSVVWEEEAARLIEISVETRNNTVVLKIKDTGCGIPDLSLPKIFTPYFTTKGVAAGTGIGLYMAKMIVEKEMQGQISVENLEEGARFIIILPLSDLKGNTA